MAAYELGGAFSLGCLLSSHFLFKPRTSVEHLALSGRSQMCLLHRRCPQRLAQELGGTFHQGCGLCELGLKMLL